MLDEDDSSDGEDSSGDESVDEPPIRPPRADRDLEERMNKRLEHTARINQIRENRAEWRARLKNYRQATGNANAILPEDTRDFIFMEYLPLGDLQHVLYRVVDGSTTVVAGSNDRTVETIPNEILWSFWLCWPAMHDYDEKDDPDDGIGQGGSGVGPMPTKIDIKMEDMLTRPDSQVEAEHDVIPMLKEQFTPDWDYIPLDRDGDDIVNEPVAGNFDDHSNVFQCALVMWQLITLCIPPRPPRLVTERLPPNRFEQSYGVLLFDPKYRDVDRELRTTIFRCLKHVPSERPTLETLQAQALRAVARRNRDATPGEVRGWVQEYIYDA
ncbi:kinase-like domain-containing protein [Apiospora kogelbergensis]|uniref:Kinase-like domain-containing protein n=1 Tax=Apiospora kogelbergensis TaxID=1337665 RepID=A0AAW0R220_9PEZI